MSVLFIASERDGSRLQKFNLRTARKIVWELDKVHLLKRPQPLLSTAVQEFVIKALYKAQVQRLHLKMTNVCKEESIVMEPHSKLKKSL